MRRRKKTLRDYTRLAKKIAVCANTLQSVNVALQNIALAVMDVEAELDGLKKWKERFHSAPAPKLTKQDAKAMVDACIEAVNKHDDEIKL